MKVYVSNTGAFADLGAIVSSHKARLGNKYAFLFNKEAINRAKSNTFPKPPKRAVMTDLDTKLEEEASTSASSGDSADKTVRDGQIKLAIAAGSEDQAATTKKLLDDLLAFEEFLASSHLSVGDTLREIRKFGRFLVANVLSRREEFGPIAKEGISLGVMLLTAEKFELDQSSIFSHLARAFNLKRVTKLAKVRHTKAYALLSPLVECYDATPSSP
jgi:hypothetical protein